MYHHICVTGRRYAKVNRPILMDRHYSHFSNNNNNKLGEIQIENLKDYYERRLLNMITYT